MTPMQGPVRPDPVPFELTKAGFPRRVAANDLPVVLP